MLVTVMYHDRLKRGAQRDLPQEWPEGIQKKAPKTPEDKVGIAHTVRALSLCSSNSGLQQVRISIVAAEGMGKWEGMLALHDNKCSESLSVEGFYAVTIV